MSVLRRALASWRVCLGVSVICVVSFEFLATKVYTWTWWNKIVDGDPSTRILIVSDPQLIGYRNEPHGVGPFSRWDSDRYLSSTYSTAHSFVEPDLVIFLGDLVDEGVEGSTLEHSWTIERFRRVFNLDSVNEQKAQFLFIAGDNDVGGEGEYVVPALVNRFDLEMQNTFNMSQLGLGAVEVQELNGFSMKLRPFFLPKNSSHRILLSHRPVLKSWTLSPQVATDVNADLILSGHDHKAAYFLRDRDSKQVHVFCLNTTMRDPIRARLGRTEPLIELQTPTCSYRMGSKNMGYGFLKIRKSVSGDIDICFSILWVPGRYPQLIAYLAILIWWGLLLTLYMLNTYRCRRRILWLHNFVNLN